MTDFEAPVEHEIEVNAPIDAAFAAFTDQIESWWPVGEYSIYGADASVRFQDETLLERTLDGDEAVWGTVVKWEIPAGFALRWHPGADEQESRLRVSFEPVGDDRTLVRVAHDGWSGVDDAAARRSEYDKAWPVILDEFAFHLELDSSIPDSLLESIPPEYEPGARSAASTWAAVLYSPRDGVLDGYRSIFEHPLFAEHVAFLVQLDEKGYLVGAGSYGARTSDGMVILRLPGARRLAEVTAMVNEQDPAVLGGLFNLEVRPWHVVLHGAVLAPHI